MGSPVDPENPRMVTCDGCGFDFAKEDTNILSDEAGNVVQAICEDCWSDAEEREPVAG